MRNLCIALIAAAALCVASPAFAFGGTHNENNVTPTTTSQGGDGGHGGHGGVGKGGNAQGGNAQGGNAQGGDSRSKAGAVAGAGVFGSGNSHVGVGPVGNNSGNSSNRNNNDSSARVGNVGAYSGVDFEDSRIGNSRNTNDLSNRNRNNVDTNTNTNTSTSTSTSNKQGQGQGQGQKQGLTDNSSVTVSDNSDNSTFVEAADIPVASAAPVFASACSAGVSGQSMGFGGSLATTNPMCDMALAAEMARAVGNDELAYELTIEAATFARARTNVVRRFGQWIPFVGSLW